MKKLALTFFVVLATIANASAQSFEAECPSGQTLKFKVIDSENLHVKVDSRNDVTGILEIPETVTHNSRNYIVTRIGNSAFSPNNPSHHGPRSVTLPGTITCIESYAFENCENLLEINMPTSIDSIFSYAFYGCEKLTSITIPSSVKFLGSDIFRSCDRLTTVYYNAIDCNEAIWPFRGCHFTELILSDSIVRIPGYTFYCSNIAGHIELPKSLSYIGHSAFGECDSITSVSIPQNLDTIEFSFNGCDNIDTVFYNAINAFTFPYLALGAFTLSGVRTIIFGENVERLPAYIFCQCTNIDSLSLPNSLKRIEDYAFCSCTSLTNLTIPENVEYIGNFAFYDCPNITSMNLKPITPPEIFQNTFHEVPTDIPITIPCHSDYPNAPYWSNFTNFIEDCDAVDENEVAENAIVYPNPVHDELHIDGKDLVRIEIVNSIGQILETFACDKEETTIDMSQYQPGLYLIRMIGEGSVSKQIIKL